MAWSEMGQQTCQAKRAPHTGLFAYLHFQQVSWFSLAFCVCMFSVHSYSIQFV